MLTWVLGEVIITDCPGAIASTAPNTLTLAFCATPLLHPACRRHPARRRYADAGRAADALTDAGRTAGTAAGTAASHADEVVNVARLGARAEEFTKVAHIPGADTLLKKLLSTSAPTLKGAEFELEFALKHADEIEEMGRVLEVIRGGNKEIDFVLKGNVFVNVKNYNWAVYSKFAVSETTAKLVKEAKSFFKYNPSAVKYVFKGSVPDSVRRALEAAGIIVEVIP